MLAPQLPKIMSLMTDLCDLLQKVLGKEVETDIDVRIAEMMADLNVIKGLMWRYTTAMEALVPTTSALKPVNETQHEMKRRFVARGEDIRWLRQQLSQSAVPE